MDYISLSFLQSRDAGVQKKKEKGKRKTMREGRIVITRLRDYMHT